ncbi:MAG: lipocalin-like domain-containing protein [Acidobacteria bacterium]|nr:lipocalin-like domain-containing protein [Acidobacteriota bacterium]
MRNQVPSTPSTSPWWRAWTQPASRRRLLARLSGRACPSGHAWSSERGGVVLLGAVGLAATLACGGSSGPEGSSPTDEASIPPAQQALAGAWSLARIEQLGAGGEPVAAPVEGRLGSLVYDATGYLGLTILGPDEAVAPADDDADEASTPSIGHLSYFGRFTVDEAAGVVTHHVAGNLQPGVGAAAEYRHPYTLSEDSLTLRWPPAPDGSTASLTWVREPDLPAENLSDAHRQLFGAYRIESVSRHTTDAYEVDIDQYDDGYLFYTPSGQMSVHLLAPGRAPYDADQPAVDETLLRTTHYFGPFVLNEVAGCITCPGPRDQGYLIHHPAGSAGSSQTPPAEVRRYYELTDTDLTLRPPRHPDEEGREVITAFRWARLP